MTHPHLLERPHDALAFMVAGNARFTLVSRRTGTRYTYRARVARPPEGEPADPLAPVFVQLLTGPSNESDYHYIGFISPRDLDLRAGRKGNNQHPAFVALRWTLLQLTAGGMPGDLEIWHEGRCGRCGRTLTVPGSIASGFGPECIGRLRGMFDAVNRQVA